MNSLTASDPAGKIFQMMAAAGLALVTILLWSFLAFLGLRLNQVPPFLLLGIALTISGLVGLLWVKSWKVSLSTIAVGVGGIFGYHFLYFTAFRYAPAVEANLINYLWPLLIVALSPLFLPDTHLKTHHLVGSFIGLIGAGLILSGGRLHLESEHLPGYLLMAAAGLTWASYSLLSKRLPPFPTGAVGAFCLVSGFLALTIYYLSGDSREFPITNLTTGNWLNLFLIGIGPMGMAFFTWDAALKRGDPRMIGALAYLTPLTSTLVLVSVGGKTLTWVSGIAMLLIIGGAVIGSLDLLRKGNDV